MLPLVSIPYFRNLLSCLLLAICSTTLAGTDNSAAVQTNPAHTIAVNDIQPLAEQGDANAQFFLGTMYRNGQNVPQDYAQAIAWYRKSAKQGDQRAQYNLGMMYSKGQGVAEDNSKAARWFRIAALQGHVPSQYNLGVLYGNGKGVPLDIIEAHKWFSIAAMSGDADAIREEELTGDILTPDQNKESRKLTEAWLAAHPQAR